VLNTCAAVEPGAAYSVDLARRLYLARRIQRTLELPIALAYALAGDALRRHDDGESPSANLPLDPESTLTLAVDVGRIDSSLAARRAALRTTIAPRTRGRPSRGGTPPLAAAEAWGLDLSLLRSNLLRTPSERLRQLDAMVDFRRRVRRAAAGTGG
jgi:hypothetical protein